MKRDENFTSALTLKKRGDLGPAIDRLNAVLVEDPKFTPGWLMRASCLLTLGHPFDALVNYDRALQLDPNSASIYNDRGTCYFEMGEFQKALDEYDKALAIKPDLVESITSKGSIHRRLLYIEDARDLYKKAISIKPDHAEAHLGLSMCQLQLGEFEEGWSEFEWRWKVGQMPLRGLPLRAWEGEIAADTNDGLLLYGEQGLGDILQFIRYAKQVKGRWGGKLYIEVRGPAARIAKTVQYHDGIITTGERIPLNVTHMVAMMSVPRILGTTVATIPNDCPYIEADSYRGGVWRQHLRLLTDKVPGKLVGLCWAGMSRPENLAADAIDGRRSMSLMDFAPVALPGIAWVSLQKDGKASEIKTPPAGMTIGDYTEFMYDLYDTAALISELDLVITVDTAVAHLAGALNKPVWMLSRYDGCWRWMGNKPTTPWYPSMRIFAQPKAGDWESVIRNVRNELIKHLGLRKAA